jgi:hypothetical protein
MSLMDIPETEQAIREILRILKPKGFLQFSISHPCFFTSHRRNMRDAQGKTYAIEVGDYFKSLNGVIDEWIFTATPFDLKKKLAKFKVPVFARTISHWLNTLISAGFIIEKLNEPYPDDKTVQEQPMLQDAQVVAYFLHIRCRKPE